MKDRLKLGVVGYGMRGQWMFQLAVEDSDFVIPVAICEPDPQKQKLAAAKYPAARIYAGYEEMLAKEQLDAVLVMTPAQDHARFCGLALGRDIHVFSDIPSVSTVEEGDMLWEAAGKSKATFMTGANPNYWALVESLCDLHRKGFLGKPFYLEAEYIHDLRNYYDQSPWRKTLPPITYCTHSLGPLLRILDEDLRYVSCFSTGSHINHYPGQQDLMTAHFRTDSNVVVRLTISFVNEAHFNGFHSLRVFGTEGYFEHASGRQDVSKPRTMFSTNKLYGASKITELPVGMERPEAYLRPDGHGGCDTLVMKDFLNAVREGRPAPIPLREGLRMTLPGVVANESANKGGEVLRIRYPWDSGHEDGNK